jgi:hypothetical protein
MNEIDLIYRKGETILCSKSCPCKANPSLFSSPYNKQMVTSSMGVSTLDQCPISGVSDYSMKKYKSIMAALEIEYKCAGMCF